VETKENSLGAVFGIFNKLSMQQKMLIAGIIIISVILFIFVVFVFNEPNYSTLYTNLAPEDAANVVDELSTQKIQYKLEDNGQTIKIPREKVYEMRLSFAAKGIPSSGIIGYEIFDKNTMGMSDFMQKLNLKRALEGEIAKTIMQQNGIEGARVHIVFPEKTIFKEDEKNPTASVVLKLSSGKILSQANIDAISNLVASSIEGLETNYVTIIDTRGKLLSRNEDPNQINVASSKNYEIKSNIENYLATKAQSLLDNVLGYGNSIVKVNVDLDFKQIEKTMETLDPESQTTISEQTVKSESKGTDEVESGGEVKSENTTTNYEISKSIERVIEGAGNIERITLAAVINGTEKEVDNNGVKEVVNEPRTEEQLQKIEQIVKQAVGINTDRKDEISIVSIPFETNQPVAEEEVLTADPLTQVDRYSNLIMIAVSVLAAAFVLKGLMKKLKTEKIVVGTVNFADHSFNDLMPTMKTPAPIDVKVPEITPKRKREIVPIGDIEDEITDEAQSKKIQHERIVSYVQKNPSDAAKLINAWLREDEY